MIVITRCVFFAAFLLFSTVFSEIIQINDLKIAERALLQLDKESLVLFDVDYTLVIPNDAVLQPKGAELFKKLESDITPKNNYPEDHLLSQVYLQAKVSLVNSNSPSLIKQIQKKGIHIIALTAAPTGKYGTINSFDDLRIKELKELGFDFSNAFPKIELLKFPKKNDKKFQPIFKSGILFSAQHPKGNILKQFLDVIQWDPKKVVFIDDSIGYLESVEQSLTELNIDFIGFHYTESKESPCDLNPKLAEFQFQYFALNAVWLSDAQAKKLMKNDYAIK